MKKHPLPCLSTVIRHMSMAVMAAILVTGCSKSVKKADGGPGGATGEDIYDVQLSQRPDGLNPENADYSTLAPYTVYFAFDSYDIDATERPKLEKVANWMGENASSKIVIAGHTDSRGTTQYNLGLGERRALAVRTYLLGLGIDANRLVTVSYGEERPAQDGESESAWAANRRAQLGVLK